MKLRPVAVSVLAMGLAGWALSHLTCSRNKGPQELGEFVIEGEVKVGENPTSNTPPAPAPGTVVVPMQEVAKPDPKAANRPEIPFEFKKEIEHFQDLNKRVFLSEADLAEKNRLLNDTALLRGLGLRLTEPSVAPGVVDSQDVAIDLLVEALKTGDKTTASEVLKSVVEDAQVESSSLAQPVREHMAGLKGEIMLRWAALAPDQAANIEKSLPGPISRKIWDNVKRRQDSNVEEGKESRPKGL